MKLDHDLVREILLQVEKEHESPDWELAIGNRENYARFYTATKLVEGGFLRAEVGPGTEPGEEYLFVRELTRDGHEFLDTVRDSAIWKATKQHAKEVGAGSIKAVLEIATGIIKQKLREKGLVP
jgi:hypothetical protein